MLVYITPPLKLHNNGLINVNHWALPYLYSRKNVATVTDEARRAALTLFCAPHLVCHVIDFITEHDSRTDGITVCNKLLTDRDCAIGCIVLLVEQGHSVCESFDSHRAGVSQARSSSFSENERCKASAGVLTQSVSLHRQLSQPERRRRDSIYLSGIKILSAAVHFLSLSGWLAWLSQLWFVDDIKSSDFCVTLLIDTHNVNVNSHFLHLEKFSPFCMGAKNGP